MQHAIVFIRPREHERAFFLDNEKIVWIPTFRLLKKIQSHAYGIIASVAVVTKYDEG
jgi:hypothetical protein